MRARFLSSITLIVLVVLIIFFLPEWVFGLTVTVFIALALTEFFRLIRRKDIPIHRGFGISAGVIIPLIVYFKFEPTKIWAPAMVTVVLLGLFVFQLGRRENSPADQSRHWRDADVGSPMSERCGVPPESNAPKRKEVPRLASRGAPQAVVGVSTTLFGILYVSWLFSYLIRIKHLPHGTALVAFLLLVTKSGDIGAFLVGTRMGRHFLSRRISPDKTIEGTLGGGILSILCALLGGKFLLPTVPVFHLLILGGLIGCLGQLGDLSESLIKRDCGAKDAGALFPGLGGVLDLIDSVLFTAPVFYFYLLGFGPGLGLPSLP